MGLLAGPLISLYQPSNVVVYRNKIRRVKKLHVGIIKISQLLTPEEMDWRGMALVTHEPSELHGRRELSPWDPC